MGWLKGIGSLVLMTLVACNQSATTGGGGFEDQLTAKTYGISNADQLGSEISVPTTKGIGGHPPVSITGASSSSASPTAAGLAPVARPKPSSVVFSEDHTFQVRYSDDSFIQGSWSIEEDVLYLTFAGYRAGFDVVFNNNDTIILRLLRSSAGSLVMPAQPANINPPQSSTAIPGTIASVPVSGPIAGAWCYSSGYDAPEAGAIASVVADGNGQMLIQRFESAEGTVAVQFVQENATSFSFQPDQTNAAAVPPTFAMDNQGNLYADYGAFKKAKFTPLPEGQNSCE